MNISNMKIAQQEAERFLIALDKAFELGDKNHCYKTGALVGVSGRYAAAAKRASLDLTRALADLRRSL